MKLFHLLPLLMLTFNFTGDPAPAKPQAFVAARAGAPEKTVMNEDEMLPWRAERKLVWEDFKSAPQKQGDAVASTSTSLGISYQLKEGVLNYTITCHFAKKKSWGSLKTEYILAHEQAHFDITEIHARKLYEALYNYEFNPASFKSDIGTIYDRIVKEKEAMQEAYDHETDHSRKKRAQYQWFERIDMQLAATEPYASYP
jgi:hypothetical protein